MRTLIKKINIDMLNGSIVDKLFIFVIPLALTSLLQQFFISTDMMICGRYVGSLALAAIGANTHIVNLFANIFIGISIGINVMTVSYIGEQKKEKLVNVVQTSISFALIIGIILLIIGEIFSERLLILLGTPAEILNLSSEYLKIYFLGIPFFVVYNFGTVILRSVGDTNRPLIVLIIVGILNIVMNLIFVRICNLGVSGVAIATSISNALSSIFIITILMNENSDIKFHINKLYLNFDALYKILRIGIPCAIQRVLLSASNLCVQSSLNSLGADTIAANAAALNLEYFSLYVLTAFGHACSTFLSENYSAKKIDRCKKIYLDCLIYGSLSSLIIVIVFLLFSKNLITLFTTEQNVIDIAMIRIKLVGSLIWIQTLSDVSSAAIRALRHPHLPSIITISFSVALRVFWCILIFPLFNTYEKLILVFPISWAVIDIIMVLIYIKISKKEYNCYILDRN